MLHTSVYVCVCMCVLVFIITVVLILFTTIKMLSLLIWTSYSCKTCSKVIEVHHVTLSAISIIITISVTLIALLH